MDFRDYSVEALAQEIKNQTLTARAVTEAALNNIQRLNPVLNAFCAVNAEDALRQADQIDASIAEGADPGPLAGIPLGVKDMEDAKGFVTTYGSALHTGDQPASADSIVVQRLRAAGCVVLGKTNTPEYGCKALTDNVPFGTCLNPWNTERTPGGSSGGTAAALASGMIPLATGSDGGGSIRIPAALCGFSGIKTSTGLIPLGGPKGSNYGVVGVKGPMALTTRDTAYALDVCVGHDPSDLFSLQAPAAPFRPVLDQPALPTKVIWSPTLGFASVDKEVAAVCEQAIDQLAENGVQVIRKDDIWPENPVQAWLAVWQSSCARSHGHLRGTADWEKVDKDLRVHIEAGLDEIRGQDYADALCTSHHLNIQLLKAFESAPLILTPTCSGQTPKATGMGFVNGEEALDWVGFTPGFNLTRNPVGSICCGFTADGMPVGLQIIGGQHQDLEVLKAMCALEDLLGIDRRASI